VSIPNHTALLAGPALLLLAQCLIPGGSPDPLVRQGIVAAHPDAWALSHQLFVVAFAFLFWWLLRLWSVLAERAPRRAAVGVFCAGFALLADFGIATLQLLTLEAVQALPPEQALAVMRLATSPRLMLFVFAPYLGFAVGFVLLAWAWATAARAPGGRPPWATALLLAAAGLGLTAGGLSGSKAVFVAAALALLAFTVWWVRGLGRQAGTWPAATRLGPT
jgi:hypothetical protein